VRSDKYRLVSQAVLQQLPENGPGLTAEELVTRLGLVLPIPLFPSAASVRWFMTAVRIDLEARGLIRRVGTGKPTRYLASRKVAPTTDLPGSPSILIPDWSGPGGSGFPRSRVV
jgi:hypothetical protein